MRKLLETSPAFAAHYLDRWIADAGDRVQVMAEGEGDATIDLIRLRGLGDLNAGSGGTIGDPVDVVLRQQMSVPGSFARANDGPGVAAGQDWRWTLHLYPTLVDAGTVIDWGGGTVTLHLDQGQLHATVPGARAAAAVDARAWTGVEMALTGGELVLRCQPIGADAGYRAPRFARTAAGSTAIRGPLVLGGGFNGKIGAVQLHVDASLVARWDFSRDMTRQSVSGEGPGAAVLDLVNAPRRAVTGALWTGEEHDWRTAPAQYDAIHFHDDDVADCGWTAGAELQIPGDCGSGVYAVRMTAATGVRHTPLFVRPARPRRLVFLASTFSYLAYGNSLWASPSGAEIAKAFPAEAERMMRSGLSTYSRHRDGSGVGLVSTRRPILNLHTGFLGEKFGGQILLNDDLRVVEWLEHRGEPYDVVTDHDLHARGMDALSGCEVLVTGTHPEYHSAETLDAIAAFQERGGRLIYLGGNGFYWRVATLPDAPHVMEVRRAEGGIRMWAEPPGEYHHQSDGRLGGMWRRLGRAPNRLVGVGYSAQGDEVHSQPYDLTSAADNPRAAFLFEGVEGPTFGRGWDGPSAAGYELDRADPALDTPEHALVVARSQPFDEGLFPVNEERLTHTVLDADDPLRADLTFFETPAGGAVLSVGSVYYATCLAETKGAGRVIANALDRFLDPAPFVMPYAKDQPGAD